MINYSSRSNVFFNWGGWWVQHGWRVFCAPLSLAACLSRSIVGSLNVPWGVLARVKEPRPNNLWRSCTSTHRGCGMFHVITANRWRAHACPEEQKLHASIAKNQELQDLRLDATTVVSCGLVVTCFPHKFYVFKQFSHVETCSWRWFLDCHGQILAKLGAAGRVDSWEEPSVRDASWQQWYAATVKSVVERNPWKSSGPCLLLCRVWLASETMLFFIFHRPMLE